MSGIKILATQEWVNSAITAALGGSIVGMVDENNNIILTGDLDAGTYYLKYEGKDGSIIDIGNLFYEGYLGESFTVPVTWNIGYAIQQDTTNGKFGDKYTDVNYAVSELMPLKDSYVYTVYGENWTAGDSCYAMWYTENGGFIKAGKIANGDGWNSSASGNLSFVLNPPEGAGMFRLQSYCNSNFSQLDKVAVEATINRTKKYSTIPITWYEGVKLSKTDGSIESTGTNYSASEFIPVENKLYGIHTSSQVNLNMSLIFFDANKTFISYVSNIFTDPPTPPEVHYEFTPPENAAYMKLRAYTTGGNSIDLYKLAWVDLKKENSTYTNQIPISTDANGNVYNSTGWKANTRINSSGAEADGTSYSINTTGFIPIKTGDVLRGSAGIFDLSNTDGYPRIVHYDSSKTYLSQVKDNEDAGWTNFTINADGSFEYTIQDAWIGLTTPTAYVRVCARGINANAIITVNEPIA